MSRFFVIFFFPKITLGNKKVWKFISEGVNEWRIIFVSLRPYLIVWICVCHIKITHLLNKLCSRNFYRLKIKIDISMIIYQNWREYVNMPRTNLDKKVKAVSLINKINLENIWKFWGAFFSPKTWSMNGHKLLLLLLLSNLKEIILEFFGKAFRTHKTVDGKKPLSGQCIAMDLLYPPGYKIYTLH